MKSNVLAILFAVISNSLLYIGMVLEKKGASELPDIEHTTLIQNVLNFIKNPRWLAGFMMTNLQILFYWTALSFGPLSLITPMLGVGLVVLIIFSRYYLGETIDTPMYAGIAAIVAGIIVLGATSSTSNAVYSYPQLIHILMQPNAIKINIILIAGCVLPMMLCVVLKYRYTDILCGIASGCANAFGSFYSMFMVTGFNPAKWEFYVFLLLISLGYTMSMVIQQFGFQKGQAVGLVPIYVVLSLILPTLTGVWLFNEWAGNSSFTTTINLIALAGVLAGVAVLSFFNAKKNQKPAAEI